MLGAALTAVVGCGGTFSDQARRALYISAETLVSVDGTVAPAYAAASEQSVDIAADLVEYRRLMAPWNELELTLRMARAALLRSESELDSYEHSGRKVGLVHAVGCLTVLFENMFNDLHEVGIRAPESVMTTVQVLRPFGGFCDERIEE